MRCNSHSARCQDTVLEPRCSARQIIEWSGGQIIDGRALRIPVDPEPFTLVSPPSDYTSFNYQWYFKNGIFNTVSIGDEASWTRITSGGGSVTYDPPGPLTTSRSYACLVSLNIPNYCGPPKWAIGTMMIGVHGMTSVGELVEATERLCNGGDPGIITQRVAPTSTLSFTYQWYYRVGLHPPIRSRNNRDWIPVTPAATGATYNPPAGISSTRTYSCWLQPSLGD